MDWSYEELTRLFPAPSPLLFILYAVLGLNLLIYVLKAETALSHSFSINPVEPAALFLATHWDAMFQPINQVPTYLTLYPPTYPVIVGSVNEILSNIYLSGRLVIIFSTILATGLVMYSSIVYSSRRTTSTNKVAGIFGGAAFLFSPYISAKYSFYAGPNVLALTANLGAITWFLTYRDNDLRRDIGCILFCLVALFTKQSMIAVPAAITLTLAFKKNYRSLIRFSGGLILSGLSILGLFILYTNGEAWLHLVTYNRDHPYSLIRALTRLGMFLGIEGGLLLGIIVSQFGLHNYSNGSINLNTVSNNLSTVITTYIFTSLIFGLFFLTKAGSAINHLLPFHAAISIVVGSNAGELASRFGEQSSSLKDAFNLPSLFVAIFVGYLLISAIGSTVFAAPLTAPDGSSEVSETIDCQGGLVLSTDPGLVLNSENSTPALNDPFTLGLLDSSGRWNSSIITTSIRNRRFSYIIVREPITELSSSSLLWNENQIDAIREFYELHDHIGTYWIYKPENRIYSCG